MKPRLAFQNPSPPPPLALASGRTAQAVRLVAISDRDRRPTVDDLFAGTPQGGRQGEDERWPAAARLLVMVTLALASWAAIVGGLVALFR